MTLNAWLALAGFAAVSTALSVGALMLGHRALRRLLDGLRAPASDWTPRATVILPCKDCDPNLGANIRALLAQDYPYYELLFAVGNGEDPAVPVIRAALADIPIERASLVIAGRAQGCAEKLNNQRAAMREADPVSEVFVFVDSDMRAQPDFLRRLVSPLKEERTGAATGFRWYIPERGGLGSLLRMVWIGGGLITQLDERVGYAWGGAMAIRRATFERLDLPRRWARGLSDDMLLSAAVREAKLRIAFVPQCGAPSYEDSTLAETIEFTNRQVTISRVYHPAMWGLCAAAHALIAALPLAACALAFGFALPVPAVAALVLLTLLPVFANAWVGARLVPAVAVALGPQAGAEVLERFTSALLLTPATMALLCLNVARSLSTRTITWRGTRYRLVSPAHTVVCS
ncbi:MAG: glycosyltransferase [Planctomycetes bacterium]|nr:glycosyltransferase [Planctomycetota bacterium]